MFNVTNKTILAATILAAATFTLQSCGDSKEKREADQLYNSSSELIDNKNYTAALSLLDTLDVRYRAQTEIRRNALRLRVRAQEGMAQDSIAALDIRLCSAKLAVDSIAGMFKHIDSSVGLDGYYIPKKADDKILNATGIQARVTDDGLFYIVANIQGRRIGLNSIQFINGADNFTTASAPQTRLLAVEGSELLSFTPEEVSGFGIWLQSHPGTSKYALVGNKGQISQKLTKQQYEQICLTYEYAAALQELRISSIKREKFERMLQITRDQLANLPVNTENNN